MQAIVKWMLGGLIVRALLGAGIAITTYTLTNSFITEVLGVLNGYMGDTPLFQVLELMGFSEALSYMFSAMNAVFIITATKSFFKIDFNPAE